MNKQLSRQSSYSDHLPLEKDIQVMKQLEDMKDQTAYMKQFRAALGSALDEVKTLRSELAQEKTKGIELLQVSHRTRSKFQSGIKQKTFQPESNQVQNATNKMSSSADQKNPLVHNDVSQIIAESEERLDHVRDAILKRSDLIQNLKKKLQLSNSTLNRRENKLETKINEERNLKSEVQTLTAENDDLKNVLEQKTNLLQKENDLVRLKDHEIKKLSSKMSHMENNLNNMYRRMSDRDRELSDARHQLRNYSSCPDCPWMRDYIRKLEYQLEHYRYAEAANPYGFSNSYIPSNPGYEEGNRWFDSTPNRQSSTVPPNGRPDFSQPSQHQPRNYKSKHTEAQKRLQVAHRQRIQEFRNASLVLSPIREDSEEAASTPESNGDLKIPEDAMLPLHNLPNGSKPPVAESKKCENNPHTSTNHNLYIAGHPQYNTSPAANSSPNSYHYITVRNDAKPPDSSKSQKENHSMAYLQISSGDQKQIGLNQVKDSSRQTNLINGSISKKPDPKTRTDTDCMRGDGLATYSASSHTNSTPIRSSETSLLHRLALSSAKSSPDLSLSKKAFSSVRSFPFLNSSVTSSGSVASTESGASDTTGCSSDSGLAYQVEKKRVKSKRNKRSGKNSKYIMFRDHKIDITRFSTDDFREIMWSLCADPNAADEFLTFLSAHAKRLHSDPQWSGKHSLGTPEEWLALKVSKKLHHDPSCLFCFRCVKKQRRRAHQAAYALLFASIFSHMSEQSAQVYKEPVLKNSPDDVPSSSAH